MRAVCVEKRKRETVGSETPVDLEKKEKHSSMMSWLNPDQLAGGDRQGRERRCTPKKAPGHFERKGHLLS